MSTLLAQFFDFCDIAGEAVCGSTKAGHIMAGVEQHAWCGFRHCVRAVRHVSEVCTRLWGRQLWLWCRESKLCGGGKAIARGLQNCWRLLLGVYECMGVQ